MRQRRQRYTDSPAFALAALLDFRALPLILAGAEISTAYKAALVALELPARTPARRHVTGDLFEWRKAA